MLKSLNGLFIDIYVNVQLYFPNTNVKFKYLQSIKQSAYYDFETGQEKTFSTITKNKIWSNKNELLYELCSFVVVPV